MMYKHAAYSQGTLTAILGSSTYRVQGEGCMQPWVAGLPGRTGYWPFTPLLPGEHQFYLFYTLRFLARLHLTQKEFHSFKKYMKVKGSELQGIKSEVGNSK